MTPVSLIASAPMDSPPPWWPWSEPRARILEDEEAHIDWREIQLGLIEKIGLENFLQSHIEPGN